MIRKANHYKRMIKATKEHTVMRNLVNRYFKQSIPGKIILINITYLNYKNGKRAYLSIMKNSSANEILDYHDSDSLRLDIVLNTLGNLKFNRKIQLHSEAILHSDQESHYTSPIFKKKVKKIGLK